MPLAIKYTVVVDEMLTRVVGVINDMFALNPAPFGIIDRMYVPYDPNVAETVLMPASKGSEPVVTLLKQSK